MIQGIPYDSANGRGISGAVTAILTATGYATSAEIAASKGAFRGFANNRDEMLGVMAMHEAAAGKIDPECPHHLKVEARGAWHDAVDLGQRHGYRNSQASVIAPSGTIGFLMDCSTTGVEPDFSLVKHKQLVGGGRMKLVNRSVNRALETLGYDIAEQDAIMKWIEENGTVEGAPRLKEEHYAVFDCANKAGNGKRFIEPMGHVKMLEAVQPFVSGAISKTLNCPTETTVEEIENLYMESWRRGLKCVAIYRDNSKSNQPLSSGGNEKDKAEKPVEKVEPAKAFVRSAGAPPSTVRHRLPERRAGGFTQELNVGGMKFYLRTGEYADGRLGEIFVDVNKEGTTLKGVLGSFAIAVSLGLQHGVPLEELVDAFTFQKFEPSGIVRGHKQVKLATSLIDAIFRVLAVEYMGEAGSDYAQVKGAALEELKETRDTASTPAIASPRSSANGNGKTGRVTRSVVEGGMCGRCGGLLTRTGSCSTCIACGTSTGGCG
jgi:ribonucleoside-diphosphate reductase alpha chain